MIPGRAIQSGPPDCWLPSPASTTFRTGTPSCTSHLGWRRPLSCPWCTTPGTSRPWPICAQLGAGRWIPTPRSAPGSWETARMTAGAGLAAVEALKPTAGRRRPGARPAARSSCQPGRRNGLLSAQQHRRGGGHAGRTGRAGRDGGLGCAPRQRHPGHLLGRSVGAVRVDPPVAPVSGHGAARGARRRAGRGTTVNLPMPPGATGDVYLALFDEVIVPGWSVSRPTWVLSRPGSTPTVTTPWPTCA